MVFENEWSVMKGIAIIAVVSGHCCYYPFTEQFVNQWHLAVFFFVSGYFLKVESLTSVSSIKSEIIKKIKRLYIPFVIAGTVLLLLHNVLTLLYIYDTPLTQAQTINDLIALVFGLTSGEPLMGAMWFCPALLIVTQIQLVSFYLVKRLLSKLHILTGGGNLLFFNELSRYKDFIVCILCVFLVGAIGGISLYVFRIKSPLCIWQYAIISCIAFLGTVYKTMYQNKVSIGLSNKILGRLIFIMCIIFLLYLTHAKIYGRLQPGNISKENPFVIILIATMGIYMIFVLSKIIMHIRLLKRTIAIVGNYTFSIMLLHFVAFKIVNLLQCISYGQPIEQISCFPIIKTSLHWTFLYLISGIVIPILLSNLYSRLKYLIIK